MLTKIKQFKKVVLENLRVIVYLVAAIAIFTGGYLYGSNGKLTKAEIKKIVVTSEDRIISQIQRNRQRIDEQDLSTIEAESIQTDNVENLYQIIE